MSKRPMKNLDPIDRRLRELMPVVDATGVQVRIEKVVGFELFNRTAFHNYETWSDGYRVVGPVTTPAWNPEVLFRSAVRSFGLTDGMASQLWDIASGQRQGLVRVEEEDLLDAVSVWGDRREKVLRVLAEAPPLPNQRTRLAVLGFHTTGRYTDG